MSWSAPTGFSAPLVVGNTVYAASAYYGAPRSVASFNLTTGQENWVTTGQYTPESVEAYGNGMVVYAGVDPSNDTYLCVLNAATGATEYNVPVPEPTPAQITIAPDVTTLQPVAYIASGDNVSAVRLGSTSGTVLWTAQGGFSLSIPSVMGNYLLLESPLNYYAVNRTTGAVNHFYAGPGGGGGGTAPVVDLSHNQFYIDDSYGPSGAKTLTAYRMNNGVITQLWQDTGSGNGIGSPALGRDGTLYCVDSFSLMAINPVNGAILRSVSGHFATESAPLVSNGYVWEFNDGGPGLAGDIFVYRASDLSLIAELPNTHGSVDTPYKGIGVLDDTHFIFDYKGNAGDQGFDVYSGTAVPEPSDLGILALGCMAAFMRRRRSN